MCNLKNINTNYFTPGVDVNRSNNTKPTFTYNTNKIELLLYDLCDKKCVKLIWYNIKYLQLLNLNWNFYIRNLKIQDVTNSFWKHICYTLDNTNVIEINATHRRGVFNNPYVLDIKPSKLALNIDELFLKQLFPIIELIQETCSYLDNIFTGEPIFIIQCLINRVCIILSYKPRGLNIGNIIRGQSIELLRLGTIRDMELNFINIMIKNSFGVGDLCKLLLVDLEKKLVSQGSIIIGHVGILKQLFSPGLRAFQFLNTDDKLLIRCKKYTRHVSSDILELASRSSISIETLIDTVFGKSDNESKLKSRRLFDTIDINMIVRGVSISILHIQHIIDPNQKLRNTMRYGN